MNRGRIMTKAIPLLIGSGLFLSACAAEPDYGAPDYAYTDPIYGSLDFEDGGFGHFRHFDHDHGFHDGFGHGDHDHGGFGHGFAGHAGFGGHGGGGHGGGGGGGGHR